MKEILSNLEETLQPAKALKFLTDNGMETKEGKAIIKDIKEVMDTNNLTALSAPQIGIDKRIFCIRFNDVIKTFINPIVKKRTGAVVSYETNASYPNCDIAIIRPNEIEIAYYNDEFKYEDNKLLDAAAGIFMQQNDILDGILPGNINKFTEDYQITVDDIPTIIAGEYAGAGVVVHIEEESDRLTTDDLDAVKRILAGQANMFRAIGKQLSISEDELIKKTYKNLKFIDKVVSGEIVVVNSELDKQGKALRNAKNQNKAGKAEQQRIMNNAERKQFVNRKKR